MPIQKVDQVRSTDYKVYFTHKKLCCPTSCIVCDHRHSKYCDLTAPTIKNYVEE